MSSITELRTKPSCNQEQEYELIDNNDDSGRFKHEKIPRWLTEQCQEYSGHYHSEVLQKEIRCNCKRHRIGGGQYQEEKLVGT